MCRADTDIVRFDEAAAVFRMIIDCEPIRFDYNGKKVADRVFGRANTVWLWGSSPGIYNL